MTGLRNKDTVYSEKHPVSGIQTHYHQPGSHTVTYIYWLKDPICCFNEWFQDHPEQTTARSPYGITKGTISPLGLPTLCKQIIMTLHTLLIKTFKMHLQYYSSPVQTAFLQR